MWGVKLARPNLKPRSFPSLQRPATITAMQYRRLGQSGLKVSSVSLGSWLTMGNAIEQKASDDLVRHAFEKGINLFDTADIYNKGEGERALGRALEGLRREDLVLASKCFFPMSDNPNDQGLSRKHIHESINGTLQRLGTDYVDLYQCHREDPEVPLEETAQAMHDLIVMGKVLYWGTSLWPAWKIASVVELCRQNRWHAPVSNQPRYNLFNREVEAEVLPACGALGIGQIVYSPLAQGVLTGKYKAGQTPAADTRAGNAKVNQLIGQFMTEARLAAVDRLVALAAELNQTPAQVALAWCLRRSEVSSVIVGATKVSQLEDNLGAVDLHLSEVQIKVLDDACGGS